MFRLLYLRLDNHPQLKNIEVDLAEEASNINFLKPFSSVIIGPNGSGKSYLLRSIIEIFRHFNASENPAADSGPGFGFQIRYYCDGNIYEIIPRRFAAVEKGKIKRSYVAFRNRPLEVALVDSPRDFNFKKLPEYEIMFEDLVYPSKLLASAVFINDRFPFAVSKERDFYQYLGVRRTASATSTATFARKTINYLFNASKSKDFKVQMAEMLSFLDFRRHLSIQYNTRYNAIFFNGALTVDMVERFYTKWWEVEGVDRNQSNAPWGQYYYLELAEKNPARIQKLVDFINASTKHQGRISRKENSKSKLFTVDLLEEEFTQDELLMITELDKLSILTLHAINIRKNEDNIPLDQISSGENQLVLGLLGIFANIEKNALILIDEPEISLHPNWQIQYISLLKKMFAKYSDCHFIITTHSHFLISNLENDSSSIISLEKANNQLSATLLGMDVYGWSAEEILYNIFKVRTTRNFYLEMDLTDLLSMISQNSTDRHAIRTKIDAIKKLNLSVNDPLLEVIKDAENYLEKL